MEKLKGAEYVCLEHLGFRIELQSHMLGVVNLLELAVVTRDQILKIGKEGDKPKGYAG